MKLLDANVFVYAEGRDHRYREPCRKILTQARHDPSAFAIDIGLVQEILDLYARREGRDRAVTAARNVFKLFPDPYPIGRIEVQQAMLLLRAGERLSPRDAIHAAVCITKDLEGVVSADRAFDDVPGLVRFDPVQLAGE